MRGLHRTAREKEEVMGAGGLYEIAFSILGPHCACVCVCALCNMYVSSKHAPSLTLRMALLTVSEEAMLVTHCWHTLLCSLSFWLRRIIISIKGKLFPKMII